MSRSPAASVLIAAARRAVIVAVAAWLIGSITLLLGSLAAGDFATESLGFGASEARVKALRSALQLDRPLAERYARWIGGVVRFDLGQSVLYGRPAGPLVAERAGHTVVLAAAAGVLAICVGLPLGLLTGSRPGSLLSRGVEAATTVCISIPPLLASVLFVWMASLTRWLPVASGSGAGASLTADALQLVVPALALAVPLAATIERIESRAVAEALAAPCIIAAHARGVSPGQVLWRHAARLGTSSLAAMTGVLGAALISGSLAVELVTSWPGLGRLALDALRARDVVLSAGCATAAAVLVGILFVVSDVLVLVIDPRLRGQADAR